VRRYTSSRPNVTEHGYRRITLKSRKRRFEGVQAEIARAAALGMRIDYVPAENDAVALSSSAWHHVAPVAHVAGSATTRPRGRIPGQPPTLPVLRDDVANSPGRRASNA
jgi:hypothetical protein